MPRSRREGAGRPVKLNEDRALVVRWCSDDPQPVLTLARVALCVPWRDAYEVARTLVRCGLVERVPHPSGLSFFLTTDKGRVALEAYDAAESASPAV